MVNNDGPSLRPQGGYDKDPPGLASPGARSGAATWHPHAQPAANGAGAEPQAWTSRLADVPAKSPALPAASDAPASGARPGAGAAPQALESAAPCAAGPAPARLPAPPGPHGVPAGGAEAGAGAVPQAPKGAAPPAAAPGQPAPLLAHGSLGRGPERSRSPAQEPAGACAAPPPAAARAGAPVANGCPAGGSRHGPGAAQEPAERAAAPPTAALGRAPGGEELWGSAPGSQGAGSSGAALAPLGPAEDGSAKGNGAPPASMAWGAAGGAGLPAAASASGPPWPVLFHAALKLGTGAGRNGMAVHGCSYTGSAPHGSCCALACIPGQAGQVQELSERCGDGDACVALRAAALRGRCSFFETLRGSSPSAPDPGAPGGAGLACGQKDMPSAHPWPCGDLALSLAAEPPRGLPPACAVLDSQRPSKAWLPAPGEAAGQASSTAGAADGAPATLGSCRARMGDAAAGAAHAPGRSPGPAHQAASAPAAPGSAHSASATGAHGALRRPFAAMPRQRSAELCIPAEEEAFLRSLGWQECEDEAEGAPSHAILPAGKCYGQRDRVRGSWLQTLCAWSDSPEAIDFCWSRYWIRARSPCGQEAKPALRILIVVRSH